MTATRDDATGDDALVATPFQFLFTEVEGPAATLVKKTEAVASAILASSATAALVAWHDATNEDHFIGPRKLYAVAAVIHSGRHAVSHPLASMVTGAVMDERGMITGVTCPAGMAAGLRAEIAAIARMSGLVRRRVPVAFGAGLRLVTSGPMPAVAAEAAALIAAKRAEASDAAPCTPVLASGPGADGSFEIRFLLDAGPCLTRWTGYGLTDTEHGPGIVMNAFEAEELSSLIMTLSLREVDRRTSPPGSATMH